MKVCVVCAGNICRSPIARAVFEKRLVDAGLAAEVTVESAGTGGWHVGEPADPRAANVLRTHGYDDSGHSARQFRASWFERFDLVLALDHANAAHLRNLAPDDSARRKVRMLRSFDPATRDDDDLEVPDPYYGAETGFEQVLRLVERAAGGFVEELRRDREAARDNAGAHQPGPAS